VNTEDTELCYRALKSRDRRFDGVFYTGVRTTGIYCRPSCPATTPKTQNVDFFPTAAAAQSAGFRACRRCLPDATPGSPAWDMAADVAGRTMRLIADGVVEREGVEGLAARVGYTSRHLGRLTTAELGAGPLALARAKRAQTARILVETTRMPFAEVAYASGFASIRQFNDTVRAVYSSSPTELRGKTASPNEAAGRVELRLAVRRPFAAGELLHFLAVRVVTAVEQVGPGWYARALSLPHGPGVVRLTFDPDDSSPTAFVKCSLRVLDLRDLTAAVERCRRLLDADCDPVAVDQQLSADPRLSASVRARPGLRVPGHVDGHELAVRALLGQQVSVRHARTLAGLLVDRYGRSLPEDLAYDGRGGGAAPVTHEFPSAAVLAEVSPEDLPMPRARGRALNALCASLASGEIPLDRSADRADVRRALLAVPGIGPWTADYIALRALGDPDVFLPTDVGVRNALRASGEDPKRAERLSQAWRPWRSYAQMHLWTSYTTTERTEMWTLMDSPVGELRIVSNGTAITAIDFAGHAAAPVPGRPVGLRDDAHPLLVEAVRQLRAYFDRDLKDFDLPLAPSGTTFQQSVWERLKGIGYGETASYGEIAVRMGMRVAASRAVGMANGRNPIPIVIPCHRVVGADGTLTGYGGGLERKQILLELEQDALF